jgi:cysteine-rich repeat protein
MHIVEEYNAAGNSQSFEATFISYKNTYSSFIWTPTSQNPVLGNVRGKIVIIQDFAGAQVHGLLYSTFTVLPHKWFNTNWDLYDKWTAVKGFLTSANAAGVSQLSFWTGHGGSFPYFVASGKSSPGNGAPRLVTGLTTPGFKSSYPDFPRVACFIGICSIVFEGINILGFNYISSQNLNYLGIIFTDFVGDNLLQKAIGMNTGKFTPCPVPLPTQGCTYCSSTGQCLGCNDTIHYIYDTASSTCFADKGYFLSVLSPTANIPVLCSVPMIGCLECTSGTTCTVCDIFANYALNVTVCSAAPGFYLDSASIPVPCYLTGCFQCITATTCAVCSTANNYIMDIPNPTCICDSINLFIQHPTAPACICKPGYFLSSTGTCNLIPVCPDLGSGCLNCTLGTPNVCAVCDAANNFIASTTFPGLCECIVTLYFDGTACVNCNTTLSPACTDCVSSTLCLACSGNFTLFQGDCICKPQYYLATAGQCLSCPIGCLQCNNASVCLICDTNNNFTLISSVCQCNSGLFLQNTACVPCGAMPGCITCNTLGCTGCDAIFGFTLNPTTSICECNFGFFVNSMIVCEACTQLGCLNCLSNTNCIQCDTTLFVLVNGTCEDICGDGIVYTVACDDGNLVNGDGCSSTCTVETDYTCVGGSTTSASLCSFSGTINI